MDNTVAVHVKDSAENLLHEYACLVLAKVAVIYDEVKHLSAGTGLHRYVNELFVLECLIHADYIGMVHGLVELHFICQDVQVGLSSSFFLNVLQGNFLPSLLALAQLHCSEGTGAHCLLFDIIKLLWMSARVIGNECQACRLRATYHSASRFGT